MGGRRIILNMHIGGKFAYCERKLSYVGGDVVQWDMGAVFVTEKILSEKVAEEGYKEAVGYAYRLPTYTLEDPPICLVNFEDYITFNDILKEFPLDVYVNHDDDEDDAAEMFRGMEDIGPDGGCEEAGFDVQNAGPINTGRTDIAGPSNKASSSKCWAHSSGIKGDGQLVVTEFNSKDKQVDSADEGFSDSEEELLLSVEGFDSDVDTEIAEIRQKYREQLSLADGEVNLAAEIEDELQEEAKEEELQEEAKEEEQEEEQEEEAIEEEAADEGKKEDKVRKEKPERIVEKRLTRLGKKRAQLESQKRPEAACKRRKTEARKGKKEQKVDNKKEEGKEKEEGEEGSCSEGEGGSQSGTDYIDSSDPGSFSEAEDGDVVCKKTKNVFFNPKSPIPHFQLGMIFADADEFKAGLDDYAISNRFDFRFTKNNKKKVRAKCKGVNCPFHIYASIGNDGFFRLRTFISEHDCNITFKNSRADFMYVGKKLMSKLRIIPTLKLIEMKRLAREEIKVDVNLNLCSKARSWAAKELVGDVHEEFNKLFGYAAALRSADPEGSFEVVVDRPSPSHNCIFRRVYICFSALKTAFKRHCRKIVNIDGCFLKGPFKGELLSAVGRDANDQIYPIAWAVVEGETRDSWAWFLDHLSVDLEIGDGEGFTFMSDMQKGLEKAINVGFPKVEHRFCARHFFMNWRQEHKGNDLQKLFWACCKSTTEADFYIHASAIGNRKAEALEELLLKDPAHFCRAFFKSHSKSDAVDNNFAEAFNAAILQARYLSIVKLLQHIRLYVMERIVINRARTETWLHRFGPKIMDKLATYRELSTYCDVKWNGGVQYEVECGEDTVVVNTESRTCTCRVWEITGIPCPHAIRVLIREGKDVQDFVHPMYSKDTNIQIYSHHLPALEGEKHWPKSSIGILEPPIDRAMPGRPKKKRRLQEGESACGKKWSGRGRILRCRICLKRGHNKKTCPDKDKHKDQGQATNETGPAPTNASETAVTAGSEAGPEHLKNTPLPAQVQTEKAQTNASEIASNTLSPNAGDQTVTDNRESKRVKKHVPKSASQPNPTVNQTEVSPTEPIQRPCSQPVAHSAPRRRSTRISNKWPTKRKLFNHDSQSQPLPTVIEIDNDETLLLPRKKGKGKEKVVMSQPKQTVKGSGEVQQSQSLPSDTTWDVIRTKLTIPSTSADLKGKAKVEGKAKVDNKKKKFIPPGLLGTKGIQIGQQLKERDRDILTGKQPMHQPSTVVQDLKHFLRSCKRKEAAQSLKEAATETKVKKQGAKPKRKPWK